MILIHLPFKKINNTGGHNYDNSAKMVKELREITGAGMMDCKKSFNRKLMEILRKAIEVLREKD